jgi:hypothetical protein
MISEKTEVLYLTRDDMLFWVEKSIKFEDVNHYSFTPMIFGLIKTHGIVYFTDTDGRRKTLKERR